MTKDLSSPDHDQDEPAPVDTLWGLKLDGSIRVKIGPITVHQD